MFCFRRKGRRSDLYLFMFFSSCYKGVLLSLFIVFLYFRPFWVVGQSDSIQLREVTVRGVLPERYMAGLFVQSLDSSTLNQFALKKLDEILGQTTPLAFRNYGNGQLSSIGFRGLSSNHTAVLWNGVNINLPTIGQTDFSSLSVASFDKLTIQYGAGAAQLGTDAIGGGISLESTPLRGKRFAVRGGVEYGSFGNWSAQASSRYQHQINDRWSLSGKTQFNTINYLNNYSENEFKGRRLEHSRTHQKSFSQDLFFEHKKGRMISAHLWVNDHQLTLWPDVIASRELTGINSFRSMLKYSDGRWTLRGSFVSDLIDYGTGDYSAMDRSRVDRSSVKADREWRWQAGKFNGSLVGGVEVTYFKALVDGFGTSGVDETRGDLFILSRLVHASGLIGSVNLRQSVAEGFSVPFTPSFGLEYPIIRKENYKLSASGSLARSYRVPTLNERYWKDLGNPDILPESGFNKELGLSQEQVLRRVKLKSRLNIFHNKVDNWVYWNPTTSYRAENVQMVIARGAELFHSISFLNERWKAGLDHTIGYTRSTQEKSYDTYSTDLLGKQLRFTPVWVSNLSAFVRYRNSQLMLQHQFESVRYTTFDNRQYLPAYQLIHVLLQQTIRLGQVSAQLQGRVWNLTNQLYLNAKSMAMPGRSFQVSLLIDYQL